LEGEPGEGEVYVCFYCRMGLLVAVIRINESHYLKTRNERINLYPYYFMSHLMFYMPVGKS